MKLEPLGDRVVLKQLEAEETTASGIVIPGKEKELPQQAEVREILWLSELDAVRALTYDSDREILQKAAAFLRQRDAQKGV